MDAELARQIWRYEPDTGKFFWLVSPKYDVLFGDEAGYFDGKYNRLRYKKKNYKSSRVAWLMMTGQWPVEQIDHINRIKTDDRFCNLRQATNSQNVCNQKVRSDNKLGVKGVCRTRYAYVAQVVLAGKLKFRGNFRTAEAAKAAYDKIAAALHGEYASTGDYRAPT